MNLLLLLFLHIWMVLGQESCKDYHDQPGICIPIKSCKSLYELDEKPNQSFDERLLINENLCGPESTKKVCCIDSDVINRQQFDHINIPIDPKRTTQSTTIPETTPETTPKTISPKISGLFPIPGSDNCGVHFPDKVHGGTVTAIDEHPWIAKLQYKYYDGFTNARCAGVLINALYVLTAAHCIPTLSDTFNLTSVRLGEWNTATKIDCIGRDCAAAPQDIVIQDILINYRFVSRVNDRFFDFYHDIALIRLTTPAKFSRFVRPICLPITRELQNINDFHGKNFEISGWGKTENNVASNLKLRVGVTGVGLETCNRIYKEKKNPITKQQICAGGDEGKGACDGDTGGPLMRYYRDEEGNNFIYAAGIISYGIGCGNKNAPIVFTNVASYMDWIEAKIQNYEA